MLNSKIFNNSFLILTDTSKTQFNFNLNYDFLTNFFFQPINITFQKSLRLFKKQTTPSTLNIIIKKVTVLKKLRKKNIIEGKAQSASSIFYTTCIRRVLHKF